MTSQSTPVEASSGPPPPNILGAKVFLPASGHRVVDESVSRPPRTHLVSSTVAASRGSTEEILSQMAARFEVVDRLEVLLAHQSARPGTHTWDEWQLIIASPWYMVRPLRRLLAPVFPESGDGPVSSRIDETGRTLASDSANLERFRVLFAAHLVRSPDFGYFRRLVSQRFSFGRWLDYMASTPEITEAHRVAHELCSSTPYTERELSLCALGGFSNMWTEMLAGVRTWHNPTDDLEAALVDCPAELRDLRLRLVEEGHTLPEADAVASAILGG